MKIGLITGSPKAKNSTSEYLLASLRPLLPEDSELSEFKFSHTTISDDDLVKIPDLDRLIFAFPLYVDGIPSHLLHCLSQLETYLNHKKARGIRVSAIVNCGFYEGRQASIALSMMKNWSRKANLEWGQGIGIGGGGFLSSLDETPANQAQVKNLGKALKILSSNIPVQHENEDVYTVPNFPRAIYTLGGNMGWRSQIKKNGLSPKDLLTRK